jgi:hypothetical protein
VDWSLYVAIAHQPLLIMVNFCITGAGQTICARKPAKQLLQLLKKSEYFACIAPC